MSSEAYAPSIPDPIGLGEDPLYHFIRVYVLFLQGLFKQFPTGSYKWSDDENLSEIVITDQVPIPKDRIEQRPAIVTMRGQAQFGNLTLDQMRTINARTGMKERTDLVACTMSLNCIAKMGPEAQRIGWIVMRHIRDFRVMLQRAGFHQIGDNLSIGPESPPGTIISGEGDLEASMVTVFSPFFFQWTERTTPLYAPVAQSIELHLQAGLLNTPVDSTAKEQARLVLQGPTVRGRPVGPQPQTDRPVIQQTVKS